MPRNKAFDEREVLEKAMELFWKQGYHATSIQNLVEHLGINRASLYNTYGGKETLFEQAFNQYLSQSSKRITGLLEKHSSVREGLRQLFLQTASDACRDPERKGCFVVNTTTELVPNEPAWADKMVKNRELFESLFLGYLQKGVDHGEVPAGKDLQAIASYLFMFYNGLQVVTKTDISLARVERAVEVAISVLE